MSPGPVDRLAVNDEVAGFSVGLSFGNFLLNGCPIVRRKIFPEIPSFDLSFVHFYASHFVSTWLRLSKWVSQPTLPQAHIPLS